MIGTNIKEKGKKKPGKDREYLMMNIIFLGHHQYSLDRVLLLYLHFLWNLSHHGQGLVLNSKKIMKKNMSATKGIYYERSYSLHL